MSISTDRAEPDPIRAAAAIDRLADALLQLGFHSQAERLAHRAAAMRAIETPQLNCNTRDNRDYQTPGYCVQSWCPSGNCRNKLGSGMILRPIKTPSASACSSIPDRSEGSRPAPVLSVFARWPSGPTYPGLPLPKVHTLVRSDDRISTAW
jgi:hypothetical protein